MWRGVAAGVEGYSSLPRSEAPEAGVLIQQPVQYPGSRMTTAGEAWRQVRNNWIIPYGGALFLIMLGALAIVFFTRGPLRLREAETGRKIERFTPFERSAHWANAIAFCILAISGLVMAFGKFFLLPVTGPHAVRMADLCAEEPAQFRRAGVRGVAGRSSSSLSCATTGRNAATCAGCSRSADSSTRTASSLRRTASTPAKRWCSGAAFSAGHRRRRLPAW